MSSACPPVYARRSGGDAPGTLRTAPPQNEAAPPQLTSRPNAASLDALGKPAWQPMSAEKFSARFA
jgi:hypothetical protein